MPNLDALDPANIYEDRVRFITSIVTELFDRMTLDVARVIGDDHDKGVVVDALHHAILKAFMTKYFREWQERAPAAKLLDADMLALVETHINRHTSIDFVAAYHVTKEMLESLRARLVMGAEA